MTGVKGKSGDKKKPNKKKELTGSKHYNPNAIEFDTVLNAVDLPRHLKGLARKMWGTVCPQLCKQKVLAVTDLHNLEAFCLAYSRWRQAEKIIDAVGIVVEGATGGPIKNPACTVASEERNQFNKFGGNLGLDPASRGRLIGPQGSGNKNPFSDF
ncbi:MAG: phage terminase small subunit P27 family [Pseudomonadales bacterium]